MTEPLLSFRGELNLEGKLLDFVMASAFSFCQQCKATAYRASDLFQLRLLGARLQRQIAPEATTKVQLLQ